MGAEIDNVDLRRFFVGHSSSTIGQPFADKTVILCFAGFGAMRPEIMILAGKCDDRLPGSSVLAVGGWCL